MQGIVPNRSSAKDMMRFVAVLAQILWLSGAVRTNDSQKDLTQTESLHGDINEIKAVKDMTLGDARKELKRPNERAQRALDQLTHLIKKVEHFYDGNLWNMTLAQLAQARTVRGRTLLHDAAAGFYEDQSVLVLKVRDEKVTQTSTVGFYPT